MVLAAFTCAINREISIYVSRSGEVLDITIGGVSSVELKDMHLRRNTKRLSMVRCIHTHPGGNPQLSDVDISSLRAMRFDAMAAVGAKDGHATGIQAAFLGEYVGGMNRVHLTEVAPVYKLPQRAWMDAIERADGEVLIGAPEYHEGRSGTRVSGRSGQRRVSAGACKAGRNRRSTGYWNHAATKNAPRYRNLYRKR